MKLLCYSLLFLAAASAFAEPHPYTAEKANADAEYLKQRKLHPEMTKAQRKALKKDLYEKAGENALKKMKEAAKKPMPVDPTDRVDSANKKDVPVKAGGADKSTAPIPVTGRSSGPSNQNRVTNTGGEGAVTGGADAQSFKDGKNTGASGTVGSKTNDAAGAETIKFGK